MLKNFKETKFCKKWISFLSAFFGPWPLILLVLSAISIWFSLEYKENKPFSIVITIIAALFSGLAGTFIKDEFSSLMLEKKGLSAVRNLEAINQQIYKIRDWISLFLKKEKNTKENLEEIDRHLSMTEFNIQSGIEDWIDIVPGLEFFSKLLGSKEAELFLMKEKLSSLEKRLNEGKNDEEIKKKLKEQKKKIVDLDNTIKELKKERSLIISSGVISTSNFERIGYPSVRNVTVSDLNKQVEALLQQISELQKQLIDLEKNAN